MGCTHNHDFYISHAPWMIAGNNTSYRIYGAKHDIWSVYFEFISAKCHAGGWETIFSLHEYISYITEADSGVFCLKEVECVAEVSSVALAIYVLTGCGSANEMESLELLSATVHTISLLHLLAISLHIPSWLYKKENTDNAKSIVYSHRPSRV